MFDICANNTIHKITPSILTLFLSPASSLPHCSRAPPCLSSWLLLLPLQRPSDARSPIYAAASRHGRHRRAPPAVAAPLRRRAPSWPPPTSCNHRSTTMSCCCRLPTVPTQPLTPLSSPSSPGEEAARFPSDSPIQHFSSRDTIFLFPFSNNSPVQLQQIQRFRNSNVETA